MNLEKADLLRAAEAIRRAQGAKDAEEASNEQLEAILRSNPIWATVPGAPGPGEYISIAHLKTFWRQYQIAKALGIDC